MINFAVLHGRLIAIYCDRGSRILLPGGHHHEPEMIVFNAECLRRLLADHHAVLWQDC